MLSTDGKANVHTYPNGIESILALILAKYFDIAERWGQYLQLANGDLTRGKLKWL